MGWLGAGDIALKRLASGIRWELRPDTEMQQSPMALAHTDVLLVRSLWQVPEHHYLNEVSTMPLSSYESDLP